jgi:hypothetical protein
MGVLLLVLGAAKAATGESFDDFKGRWLAGACQKVVARKAVSNQGSGLRFLFSLFDGSRPRATVRKREESIVRRTSALFRFDDWDNASSMDAVLKQWRASPVAADLDPGQLRIVPVLLVPMLICAALIMSMIDVDFSLVGLGVGFVLWLIAAVWISLSARRQATVEAVSEFGMRFCYALSAAYSERPPGGWTRITAHLEWAIEHLTTPQAKPWVHSVVRRGWGFWKYVLYVIAAAMGGGVWTWKPWLRW